RFVRQTPQADGRLGSLLRQGRDGRGQGGRARSCANTAIASPKARGRPASRRTSFHRRCACPAPPTFNGTGDGGPMDQSPTKSRLLAQLAEAHDAWHYMKDDKGERIPTKADQVSLNWRRHAVQRAVGAFLDWAHAEGDIPSEHLILLVKL